MFSKRLQLRLLLIHGILICAAVVLAGGIAIMLPAPLAVTAITGLLLAVASQIVLKKLLHSIGDAIGEIEEVMRDTGATLAPPVSAQPRDAFFPM